MEISNISSLGNKFSAWRVYQEKVVERMLNSKKKYIFLNAPTGSGKTVIAMYFLKHQEKHQSTPTGYYVVSTKQLQDQICSDFDFVSEIKGKNAYPCLLNKEESCDECVYDVRQGVCSLKNSCLYIQAKEKAIEGKITIMNYSYFFYALNYVQGWVKRKNIVFDEAHNFENIISNIVTISRPIKYLERLGLNTNILIKDGLDAFVSNSLDVVRDMLLSLEGEVSKYEDITRVPSGLIRLFKSVKIVKENLEIIQKIDADWVWNLRSEELRISPVVTSSFAKYFLSHFEDKAIFMSATLIKEDLLFALGLREDEVEYIVVPNTFPISCRKIHILPVVNLCYKNHQNVNVKTKLVKEIDDIIRVKYNKKGLIHTVSNDLMTFISSFSGQKERLYSAAGKERDAALKQFITSKNGVLVSPSFEEGVDLPYDLCRFIIFCKVPYPSFSDVVTIRRYVRDKEYVERVAVRRFLQGIGRGVRNNDDFCEVFCLDSRFPYFLHANKKYIPNFVLSQCGRVTDLIQI